MRAALNWAAEEIDVPIHGAPLSPTWAELFARVQDPSLRKRLSSLVRYCSALGVEPCDVGEEALDAFMTYRAETTVMPFRSAERRRVARAWNRCIGEVEGWSQRRLQIPPDAREKGPDWTTLPTSLQADVEAYFQSMGQERCRADGRLVQPAQPSTIRTRRAEFIAFAKQAVLLGTPSESLTSIGALLQPPVAQRVLDARWKQEGSRPKTYTIDLAVRLHGIAREIGCLAPPDLEELDQLRRRLERKRGERMTPKNAAVIREVLATDIWDQVVDLPPRLMRQARRSRQTQPLRSALVAQMAAVIAILTFAPVRIGNLVRTRLGGNLIRYGGGDHPFWLVYPDYEVKNGVALEFPLDAETSAIVDEYIVQHRSVLLRGAGANWLFPGRAEGHKQPHQLSAQFTRTIFEHTGLRVTAHQVRHVSASLIIKNDPCNYELARQILGHKSERSTRAYYTMVDRIGSARRFNSIVRKRLRFDSDEGEA